MLTTLPDFRRCGRTACVSSMGARTLRLKTSAKSSGVMSGSSLTFSIPALLMRMSMCSPNAFVVADTIRAGASSSRRSIRTLTADEPFLKSAILLMSSSATFSLLGDVYVMTTCLPSAAAGSHIETRQITFAPLLANSRAIAAPMPLEEPVTIATFPARLRFDCASRVAIICKLVDCL